MSVHQLLRMRAMVTPLAVALAVWCALTSPASAAPAPPPLPSLPASYSAVVSANFVESNYSLAFREQYDDARRLLRTAGKFVDAFTVDAVDFNAGTIHRFGGAGANASACGRFAGNLTNPVRPRRCWPLRVVPHTPLIAARADSAAVAFVLPADSARWRCVCARVYALRSCFRRAASPLRRCRAGRRGPRHVHGADQRSPRRQLRCVRSWHT